MSLINPTGNPLYSADPFIYMDDPIFKGTVQLDFAWSLQGNILPLNSSAPPAAKN